MTSAGRSLSSATDDPLSGCNHDYDSDPLCQCQGCGAVRGIAWLGKAHACWRNEDGTYEEGGTFQ